MSTASQGGSGIDRTSTNRVVSSAKTNTARNAAPAASPPPIPAFLPVLASSALVNSTWRRATAEARRATSFTAPLSPTPAMVRTLAPGFEVHFRGVRRDDPVARAAGLALDRREA